MFKQQVIYNRNCPSNYYQDNCCSSLVRCTTVNTFGIPRKLIQTHFTCGYLHSLQEVCSCYTKTIYENNLFIYLHELCDIFLILTCQTQKYSNHLHLSIHPVCMRLGCCPSRNFAESSRDATALKWRSSLICKITITPISALCHTHRTQLSRPTSELFCPSTERGCMQNRTSR